MLILSLDTSSPVLTVALHNGDTIVGEETNWMPRGHMAKLIPFVDELLVAKGFKIDDVTHIVVGSGPGSYTGLRIGMVIARTFAQLLEVPINGVPSADAIAYRNISEVGIVCPIIDAKRAEVYTALYRPTDGSIERITEFMAIHPDELAKKLLDEGYERVVFAGDAVSLYEGVLAETLGERAVFAAEAAWWPRASDLATLALPRIVAGEFDELYKLAPIYVRLSQAEEMWEKRHQR
ncbi:MAG: tRNA (adenosine(37)-N6)-threonylcarbamoyltransferase complex dimerization subunit type 1 TsaB [Candidatus Aquicultor primus]|uniref:tRNA (Adenosine(37)-N6)-threonylcarbamoyltransferase complex dimerization subunit type 1 TsaB n=1 Tax=Candidatus Aquicultor primus TaxID=1797195 RepID=A0A1F2UL58_9ACTN|nr:MAG: tRNA (adenosine(37)-N6)-threonylcarbamoyltransferase complex dimerization subunit type 1 TsaB [Candidatus Aquicultor primus]